MRITIEPENAAECDMWQASGRPRKMEFSGLGQFAVLGIHKSNIQGRQDVAIVMAQAGHELPSLLYQKHLELVVQGTVGAVMASVAKRQTTAMSSE